MIFWLIIAAVFSQFAAPFVADFIAAIYWDYFNFEMLLDLSHLIRGDEVFSFCILGSPFIILAIVYGVADGRARAQS